jgi:uncharacterized protein (TIGR03083 family)
MPITTNPTTDPITGGGSIDREQAMHLAETAYRRFATVAATIEPDEWQRPTDCGGWTVRDLVGHVVGAMRSAASQRETVSQLIAIKRAVRGNGGSETDAMTRIQIERTGSLTPAQLVAECAALVGPATRGRRRTPAVLRRTVKIPVAMGTIDETWRLGYLIDTILTRDAWLHRVDLCRALGRPIELTADHDGVIVAGVANEWAGRHAQAFELELTGAAGGTFSAGSPSDAARLRLDAVEFCRIVSGRAAGDGLLRTEVPF